MPNPSFPLTCLPGIRRDGTELNSQHYADGTWVRFQRGLPRKMGGYRAVSQLANGPVRSVLVDSRNGVTAAHYFSQWGVQRQQVGVAGNGGGLEDRTPVSYAANPLNAWSHGLMYSSTGGSYAALLAACTPDLLDITSDVPGALYAGSSTGAELMKPVSDANGPIAVSGGVCVLQPFLFVYGSNGLIRNSNPNDFSTATGWVAGGGNFANTANVAGTKFIHGAPVRGGGQSPAGLFWALDSLVRVSFTQGVGLWSYDTLSSPTSVLSKKAILEHDGKFFWPGVDRFLMYNGVVQELPNDMNQNWFFDNLNYAQRNKVWGAKIQRFGELWWFYPRGNAEECTDAVIYNYRENTWYDAVLKRSAGDKVQTFQFPVWAGAEDSETTQRLTVGVVRATNAGTALGNNTLNFAAPHNVTVGMKLSGAGIAPNVTATGVTATTVTMSAVSTAIISAESTVTATTMSMAFAVGNVVTGSVSGAVGRVTRTTLQYVNLSQVGGNFLVGDVLTNAAGGSATLLSLAVVQPLDTVYQQEFGFDKVVGQDVSALRSSFTTQNFGFATGSPFENAPKTVDIMTRLTRFEPDFAQVGPMTLAIEGRSYANNDIKSMKTYEFNGDTAFIDSREQARLLRLTVTSNVAGGFYQQGQVMLNLEPGDERSTEPT